MDTSGLELVTSVLPAFALVVGAPLVIWWWSRRGGPARTQRLRITDKAALGRNTWIAVVEVDDLRFLVGAGERGVGMLSELDPAPENATEANDEGSFETTNGIDERPRMGLRRRLQLMTLRTSKPPSARPFDASPR